MVVFIILRHVNSETTNEYWQESCAKINQYYPDTNIFVIDDYSNPIFLKQTRELKNVTTIQSELPKGKAELLPYYYFHTYKWDTHAIILHDSVFLNNNNVFDLNAMPDKVKFLWHTDNHSWDERYTEALFIKKLKNYTQPLNMFWSLNQWSLCFGVMSAISYAFLDELDKKYDFFNSLIPVINTRTDRMRLERVFGLLCCLECKDHEHDPFNNNKSYMGDIDKINKWSYTWDNYKTDSAHSTHNLQVLYPHGLIKVFSGR
jgi:hypothetical protein